MKLQKALKLKKKITGEIASLKELIQSKNSFVEGSVSTDKFDVKKIYAELLTKVQELISLKYVINEANREIQDKIFSIGEYKGLINFWQHVDVTEGVYHRTLSTNPQIYFAQIDELERNKMIAEFQNKVDMLQEEIDTYNYTTEIPWDEYVPEFDTRKEIVDFAVVDKIITLTKKDSTETANE